LEEFFLFHYFKRYYALLGQDVRDLQQRDANHHAKAEEAGVQVRGFVVFHDAEESDEKMLYLVIIIGSCDLQ